ncbi:MAG: alpha/beta hydrolase [Gammaproteobacteria bacterium]|nr:alpha/beta hydrolase [Gammaproteobacteria bacterium]
MQDPGSIETGAVDSADGSVIWLHGLGADGHDFEPVVPELRLGDRLRFVFPHAPVRPVTLNGGIPMRAWYDIVSLERGGPVDEQGIRDSAARLDSLLQREHERGLPWDRIVVAGFSQGGAIALHVGLRHPEQLAGIMALSTYLPLQDRLPDEMAPGASGRPVFVGHGTFDPVVPCASGENIRDTLLGQGFAVEWHDYPIPHSVCAEEIDDIRRWLLQVLPPV